MARELDRVPMANTTDEILKKRQKRREYNLMKQHQYKAQQRDEIQRLQLMVYNLTGQLGQLQRESRSTMLSWQCVADALREDLNLMERTNTSLCQQIRQHQVLIRSLLEMAAINANRCRIDSQICQLPQHQQYSTFHLVRLGKHREARRHGYDWLTNAAFLNTNKFLNQYSLGQPRSDSVIDTALILDTTNLDDMHFVHVFQAMLPGTMEHVFNSIRNHLVGAIIADESIHIIDQSTILSSHDIDTDLMQQDSTMRYTRRVVKTQYGEVSDRAMLYREFVEDDRIVLVAQNIPLDEEFAMTGELCKNLSWIVLDRIDAQTTTLRIVRHNSHCFYHDGTNFTFEEEASLVGFDPSQCPEELKAIKYKSHLQDSYRRLETWTNYIQRAVDEVTTMETTIPSHPIATPGGRR